MQNSTQEVPLFQTQFSNFSQNGHDTMGNISEKSWQRQTHFASLVEIFCSTLAQNTDKTQYQVNCKKRQHLGSILYTQR